MYHFALILMIGLTFVSPVQADFAAAMSAYEAGRYTDAVQEFRPLAQQGDADAQFMLGYSYALGDGVLQDYVEAHKWFNLAASQGKKDARKARESLEKKMTAAQLAEAQRLAREWKPVQVSPALPPLSTDRATSRHEISVEAVPSRDTVRDIQRMLAQLGYEPGPADGMMGSRTRSAIRSYQQRAGLTVDGKPSEALRSRLEQDTASAGAAPVEPPGGWTSPMGDDDEVQEFIAHLRSLIQEGELKRTADRRFLAELRELAREYDWPWRRVLLEETFRDGDYSHDPTWTVLAGRFSVASGWGLSTSFKAVAAQRHERKKRSEDLSMAILGALLNRTAKKRGGSKVPTADHAEIRTPLALSNAFALRMVLRSQADMGQFEFGPHLDDKHATGYRLVYRPGRTLELIRQTTAGIVVVEVSSAPLRLEDGQSHYLQWTRGSNGEMNVELDGKQILRVTDRGIQGEFSGLALVNRGGDYGIKAITVFGTP